MNDIAVVVATCGDDSWIVTAAERAVASVWAQTDQPDELMVGHEEHMTVSESRNHGATLVDTDWLCFLDADDMLEPGFVAAMRTAIQAGDGPRLLAPALEDVCAQTGKVINPARIPNTWQPMEVMNHCCIGTLVPRELFLEVGGFREEYGPWEDWELWLRCMRAGAVVQYVPDAVYRAYVRADSRHRSLTAAAGKELHARITREHAGANRLIAG